MWLMLVGQLIVDPYLPIYHLKPTTICWKRGNIATSSSLFMATKGSLIEDLNFPMAQRDAAYLVEISDIGRISNLRSPYRQPLYNFIPSNKYQHMNVFGQTSIQYNSLD
ncbi:uncharacterized protein LOC131233338 [Magnolia sinica]|uniref:uncharacterized protein LOC131233338 n=1 Tax=Magnolia sinica TaxID=86752 RepID=UPI0026595E3C|nr:uncharacterized protein LOC131233338 [Magnolia sinica]